MLYIDLSNGAEYLKYPYISQAMSEFFESETQFGDQTLLYFFHPIQKFVICGVNQDLEAELNLDYIHEHDITVMRRGAGGGAVYVDPGNLTYCFVDTDRGNNYQNFAYYAQTALALLQELGVPAEMGGRNDLTVDGKKFSGMSSARVGDRFSCGGTLMVDVDLDAASLALHPLKAKLRSKGVKSVHSRVTNLRQYFAPQYQDITLEELQTLFIKKAFGVTDLAQVPTYRMQTADWERMLALAKKKYGSPAWIQGPKRPGTQFHARHFAGLGTVEASFSVEKGILTQLKLYGDFSLASGNLQLVEAQLLGVPFHKENLVEALQQADLKHNLGAFQPAELAEMLLETQYDEEV
ncbi:lipoate--protein ligase [Lactobacillus sp. DCY120]|uniref:lipoate--protein ligase n=1 Tax=Bombilactobacillus apium TaxID=2675299 RepID=A0A850R6F8_9LACO|nr:lipoate--protein ligase [Bombilactobacillus apium]NVY96417.1 lipoate--protein ligase [Bombilactobacillus apium]